MFLFLEIKYDKVLVASFVSIFEIYFQKKKLYTMVLELASFGAPFKCITITITMLASPE